MGGAMSEGMEAQLTLQALERIEKSLGKIDDEVTDIKTRLGKGDIQIERLQMRVQHIEDAQGNLKKRLDEAQQEEQRQTVEVARARSKRMWDIAKAAIAVAVGGIATLLYSGARAELKQDQPMRVEAVHDRGR